MKLGYEDIRIKPFNLFLPDVAGFLCLVLVCFLFFSGVYGRTLERELNTFIPFIPLIAVVLLVFFGWLILNLALVDPEIDTHNNFGLSRRAFGFLILGATLIFGLYIESHIELTIERVHIVKYSLLGFLSFYSLTEGRARKRVLIALLVGASIGSFDEIAQFFIPDRVFDLRDIYINLLSSFFGTSLALASLQWLRMGHLLDRLASSN